MRLIDADAAIKAIANCCIYGADEIKTKCEKSIHEENGWLGGLKAAIEAVKDMPTVEPQTGEWIIDGHHIQCPICEVFMCNTDREGDPIPRNFCPNCGADMRGRADG